MASDVIIVGGGTSSASFAWANASSKTGDQGYHRLNAAGVAAYHGLLAEYGAMALGAVAAGALQLARKGTGPGTDALHRDAAILAGFGYKAQLLDNAALRTLEPGLALPDDMIALHLPDDLIIDAPGFSRLMAQRLQELGGRILPERATGLVIDDDGSVRGVETATGAHHAAATIIATGKDTAYVLAELTGFAPFASRFPLRQVPGLLLTTPPLPTCALSHVVYTSDMSELHMLPMANGGVKIGSDDVDSMIWEDQSQAAKQAAGHILLQRVERYLPGISERVNVGACQMDIGIRPYPEDGKSLIGPLPGATGLYLVATHSGITLAPVIGRLMARWLASGTRPAELAPYTLSRFPGFAST